MIDILLKPPCRVCGYNGPRYYQSGTHAKYCFFYNIGGLNERIEFVLTDWPHNKPFKSDRAIPRRHRKFYLTHHDPEIAKNPAV